MIVLAAGLIGDDPVMDAEVKAATVVRTGKEPPRAETM